MRAKKRHATLRATHTALAVVGGLAVVTAVRDQMTRLRQAAHRRTQARAEQAAREEEERGWWEDRTYGNPAPGDTSVVPIARRLAESN